MTTLNELQRATDGDILGGNYLNDMLQTLALQAHIGNNLYSPNPITLGFIRPGLTAYKVTDLWSPNLLITGSSSIKTATFTGALDFKPTYWDFSTGSFPPATGSNNVSTGYVTFTVAGNNTEYGSYCGYIRQDASYGGTATVVGSIRYNGTSPILFIYPNGTNQEIGVDCLFTANSNSLNNSVSIRLAEKTTGSYVTLKSASAATGTNVTQWNHITFTYNGNTGSYRLYTIGSNEYAMSTGALFSGSWYLEQYTFTNGGTGNNGHVSSRVRRITKFTGSEIGSQYVVLGSFSLPDNYTFNTTTPFGFTRDIGSLQIYPSRTSDSFITGSNLTNVSGTGSNLYLKFLGTHTGSFDTTTMNCPIMVAFYNQSNCKNNKW
jgi:hypothetical protein